MDTTTKPKQTVEQAKKAYHDATVEMATLDAKLIDASATLEELKTAHGVSIVRVNEARDALIDARSPSPAAEAATTILAALDRDHPNGHASALFDDAPVVAAQ